jgi:hypothetical protein
MTDNERAAALLGAYLLECSDQIGSGIGCGQWWLSLDTRHSFPLLVFRWDLRGARFEVQLDVRSLQCEAPEVVVSRLVRDGHARLADFETRQRQREAALKLHTQKENGT